MRRIRFTIASLLIVVLLAAVGFAALREANESWDSGLFSLTLGVLLISILLAVHCAESRRAFWVGFAVFGWTYLGLCLVPSIDSRLITTRALAQLAHNVPRRTLKIGKVRHAGSWSNSSESPDYQVSSVAFSSDGSRIATSQPGIVMLWDATTGKLLGGSTGTTENFVRIGHSLFALLAGWLGGLLSRRLGRSSRAPDVSTPMIVDGTTDKGQRTTA